MQKLVINVDDSADLITGYGAGALIRVERDTVSTFATATEITTIALVSGTSRYEYWDTTGTASHYYRTRYSKASPSVATDYSGFSDTVTVDTDEAQYVTPAMMKLRLGITNATDDDVLGTLCDQVNGFIESYTHRRLRPSAATTLTFDYWPDDNHDNGRILDMAIGIVSLTLLEVAPYTGAAFVTVPATDYFLMPRTQDRDQGWPATELHLSDIPSASSGQPFFARGYGTIRLTGSFYWAAIPNEVSEVAVNLSLALWRSRSAGTSDIFTIGPDGERTFERALSDKDRRTLNRYQVRTVTIV